MGGRVRAWRAGAVAAALVISSAVDVVLLRGDSPSLAASGSRPAPATPEITSGGLWAIGRSGAVEQLWRAPADLTISNPAISPGGGRVAFTYVDDSGYPELAVVGVEDHRLTRPMADAGIENVGWSDDRHLIVLESGSRRLERVDVETGVRTTIWEGDDRILSFVVSPDGRHVVFRRDCPCERGAARLHSLFAVGSDGSNPRLLLSPLHYLDDPDGMAFAPDSRHLAVLAGGRRSVIDVVAGRETVLAASPQDYPQERHHGTLHNFIYDEILAWSPTSDRVVFRYRDEAVLYPTDGRAPSAIPNSAGYGISPDGTQLAFTDGLSGVENLRLVRMPEMNGRVVMSGGIAGVLWPPGHSLHAISRRSGRRGSSGARAVWRLSPDGADPRLVARLPENGSGGADNLRSAVSWTWDGPEQKLPNGGTRSPYHDAVLVFLPR